MNTGAVSSENRAAGPGSPSGLVPGARSTFWRVLEHFCSRQSPARLTLLGLGFLLGLGLVDYATGVEISLSVFYVLPISFAAWFVGRRSGIGLAVLGALVWLAADLAAGWQHGRPASHWSIPCWNCLVRLGFFLIIVSMLTRIRLLRSGLELEVADRNGKLKRETDKRLEMERQIMAISQREQQRIAHELHDGLCQELGAAAFQAKLLAVRLAESQTPFAEEVEQMALVMNELMSRTRSFSHLLDPLGDGSGGLRPALVELAKSSSQAFSINCTVNAPPTLPRLSQEVSLHLYRIAQEAISNAIRHGGTKDVLLEAAATPTLLTLRIADSGGGFDPGALEGGHPGMGLRFMSYRAAAIGARLDIQSTPGRGCTVVCSLPLNQPPAARPEGSSI